MIHNILWILVIYIHVLVLVLHWLNMKEKLVHTVPLKGKLPPLVSFLARRVLFLSRHFSFLASLFSFLSRINDEFSMAYMYITRRKPVMCKRFDVKSMGQNMHRSFVRFMSNKGKIERNERNQKQSSMRFNSRNHGGKRSILRVFLTPNDQNDSATYDCSLWNNR